MKLSVFLISFVVFSAFAQNDTLYSFVFDYNNDYSERVKVAEQLFENDTTNRQLNSWLLGHFDETKQDEKFCICFRNQDTVVTINNYYFGIYATFKYALLGNDFAKADSILNGIAQLNSNIADGYVSNALKYYSEYYERNGYYEKSCQLLWQAYLKAPVQSGVMGQYLRSLSETEEYGDLIYLCTQLLQKHPNNRYILSVLTHGYLGLARLDAQDGDTLGAIANYRKAIAFDTSDITRYYPFGLYLNQCRYWRQADSLVKEIHAKKDYFLSQNYERSETYKWFFFIEYDFGKRRQAVKWLNKAIHIVEDNKNRDRYSGEVSKTLLKGPTYTLKGLTYTMTSYDHFLTEYYRLKGFFYMQKWKNKKAIRYYTKALQHDSLTFDALLNRGELYLKRPKTEVLAKADFERILRWSDYEKARVHFNLGKYYFYCHEYELAFQKLTLSLEQEPNNSWTNYYIAEIYNRSKNYQKAIEHIEKAIELDPNDSYFPFLLDLYKSNMEK